MAFVNSDGTNPVIDLGGGSGGSFDLSGLPTGPTGPAAQPATNYLSMSSSKFTAQGPQLFVGWTKAKKVPAQATRGGYRGDFADEAHGVRTPVLMTPFELLQHFDGMSRDQYLKLKNRLVAAGITSSSAGPADVRAAFAGTLQDVYDMQSAGASVSPNEYINALVAKNGVDPNKIPAKDGWDPTAKAKAKSWTQTATSVYDLDPAQAETMLTQMLQQKLGRDPTKTEIQDFADAVKTRSLNDPTTTTTKYHTDANGNTTSNTSTATGFSADDAALLAQKRAENAPDYKSYQAVSTYFPALVQALGATV